MSPDARREVTVGVRGMVSAGHSLAAAALGVELGDQADPFGNCTVIARGGGAFQGAADFRRDALAIGW